MYYMRVKEDCLFFGQEFFKDELFTLKELEKWEKKQENFSAGYFVKKYFDYVWISKKNIYWSFGKRLVLNNDLFF